MQLVAFSRTEQGIRRIQNSRSQGAEIAQLQAKIDALQAAINRLAAAPAAPAPARHHIVYRSTFHRLEVTTCRLFRLSRSELYSARRCREVAFARQFLMYWACRRTTLSLPQIGRLMGGRDHTTVLHGKNVYPEKRWKMGRYLGPVR